MSNEAVEAKIRTLLETLGEPLPPGAGPPELERLRAEVRTRFALEAPGDWLEFLGRMNGFELDGLSLFPAAPSDDGAGGVLDSNAEIRLGSWPSERLLLGSESASLYLVHEAPAGRYLLVDRTSKILVSRPTFHQIVSATLRRCHPNLLGG